LSIQPDASVGSASADSSRPALGAFKARAAPAGMHAMTGNADGGRDQVKAIRSSFIH
jgi:hypothetical protein